MVARITVSILLHFAKKYGAKIILTSDAHICFDIGNYEYSENILKEINFPDELIMNYPKNLLIIFTKR